MVSQKAESGPGKQTDAATSGDNASAMSTSTDSKGGRETTTSYTKDGKTIVQKIFGGSGDNSNEGARAGDEHSGAHASAGGGSYASSGKGGAFAGIVDGKAVTRAE